MIGRIISEHKTNYILTCDEVEYTGTVRGAFHLTESKDVFPKVGDIVECTETSDGHVVIENILPRKNEISRKAVGGATRQVIVANVDVMFIVMGLDGDFNLRRLERYLLLAQQSNVKPVIILNKADLINSTNEYVSSIKTITPNTPAHAVTAMTGEGMEIFEDYIGAETVAVLLGSSGAGKSTITNWLLSGRRQTTSAVREDDSRGRHTTTARQMFAIPAGGMLIDTPGMRELGVFSTEQAESEVFTDIETFIQRCRFPNCDHQKSKGCAILQAIKDGHLDRKHFENYIKLQKEREYLMSKTDIESAYERKQKMRKLHTNYNKIQKRKYMERDI